MPSSPAFSADRALHPEPAGPALPEQTFFDDPVLDRLMGVTMALAAEVYMLRSRVLDLERMLAASTPGASMPRPEGDAGAARADAAGFVARLFEPLAGEQQSKGPVR